jgi:hypothetical protein
MTFWEAVLNVLGVAGNIGAAAAGVAGVVVARKAISIANRDGIRRSTFDLLRETERHALQLHRHENDAWEKMLDLERDGQLLGIEQLEIQGYLNALDLLAFAVLEGDADAQLTRAYFRSTIARRDELLPYLRRYRACCGDGYAYEHLERYLVDAPPVHTRPVSHADLNFDMTRTPTLEKGKPTPPPPPPPPPPPRPDRGGGADIGKGFPNPMPPNPVPTKR